MYSKEQAQLIQKGMDHITKAFQVRLDENGKSGVFVRRGNIVNFRSVNIIYSEDSFVIASKPESGDGVSLDYPHLKLYDEVIISGKELKDGMVI